MFFVSKKKYISLQKEFDDWKEGRKKSLLEQAGIYPPEKIATLTEKNRLLHQKNIRLSEELEKYKKLYSDKVYEQMQEEQYGHKKAIEKKRKLIVQNI